MNQIELFKRLPKTNCGDCPQKACLPFSFSVIKGEAELADCPYLTDEERELISGDLIRSDWREELLVKMKEEVQKIDFASVAEGLGARLTDAGLVLPCLGRMFTISPEGEVTTQGHITPWVKILLLHYLRTCGSGPLSDRWVSFTELKDGMMKSTAFHRECEDPLRRLLESNGQPVGMMLQRLGATVRNDFPTPHAWHLLLLPKVPIVILFWPPEEEFESKVKILFDATADKFLDVESLVFLVEGLVKNIEMFLSLDKKKHIC